MTISNSTEFVPFGYGWKQQFVKVLSIPRGYKGKAVKAIKKLEQNPENINVCGGLKRHAVADALASVGLVEVERWHSRRFVGVDWVKSSE